MSRSRRSPLYLSRDVHYDFLTALEWGRVDDGQGPDRWREVSESFHFLLDRTGGRVVGFRIDDFSSGCPRTRRSARSVRRGASTCPCSSCGVPALFASPARPGSSSANDNSMNRDFFDRATESGGERGVRAGALLVALLPSVR